MSNKNIRVILYAPTLLLMLGGCASPSTQIRGANPAQGQVVAVSALKPSAGKTVIAGRMIEKCPTAGCWFRLQDSTGVIKVDTKTAGFVVSDLPVGTQVTVLGTLKTVGERHFEAVGLRAQ